MQDGFNFKNRLYTNIGIEISDKNVEIPPRLWTAVAKKVKTKDNVSESTKNYEKNKGRTSLVFDDNAMFSSVCKEVAAEDATEKNSFTSS